MKEINQLKERLSQGRIKTARFHSQRIAFGLPANRHIPFSSVLGATPQKKGDASTGTKGRIQEAWVRQNIWTPND
ncbi:MAG: hypothetical protein CM1200mP18_10770 [Gammaproteobacteria bacterium]|nr:MAG: hypothetical protein CM1200mP18_10770 [Gammaproteobacteria bacterium]